jgi:predicted transposase YbfD/YdcC
MSAEGSAKDFPEWPNLTTIGVAVRYRMEKGKPTSLDYRYYISSARLNEATFAHAVISNWGIENQLHWVLDATMG